MKGSTLNEFEDASHFTPRLPEEEKSGTRVYRGNKIIWFGDADKMVVVDIDDTIPVDMNIFYGDKINGLVQMIRESPEPVEFNCGYGMVYEVDLNDIIEHQASYREERFSIDYSSFDTPLSIGDEEYDEYLGLNGNYVMDYLGIEGFGDLVDVEDFFDINHLAIARGDEDLESITSKFLEAVGYDSNMSEFAEEFPEEAEGLEVFIENELDIKSAIDNEDGDIGRMLIIRRDGNHRAEAAKAVGEDRIGIELVTADLSYRDSFEVPTEIYKAGN